MAKIPTGVKVVSVLFYIGAALGVLGSIMLFVGGSFVAGLLPGFGSLAGGLFIGMGIIMLAISVLDIFVGRGLWKGQRWAWITAIVLLVLGFVLSLISLNILMIIIYGIIGAYLIFSKEVKKVFA